MHGLYIYIVFFNTETDREYQKIIERDIEQILYCCSGCGIYQCSDRNDPCARVILIRPLSDQSEDRAKVISRDSHWRSVRESSVQHSVVQCELLKHQNRVDFGCEQLMNYYWHDQNPLSILHIHIQICVCVGVFCLFVQMSRVNVDDIFKFVFAFIHIFFVFVIIYICK